MRNGVQPEQWEVDRAKKIKNKTKVARRAYIKITSFSLT